MPRPVSRAGLIEKIDRIFSIYVRTKHADAEGYVRCVTCNKVMPWREAHAGHFVRRRHYSCRWNPLNVHPQCVACNTFLDGNEGEYARFIIDTYGRQTLDELLAMKNVTRKWTMPELRELLEKYEDMACRI